MIAQKLFATAVLLAGLVAAQDTTSGAAPPTPSIDVSPCITDCLGQSAGVAGCDVSSTECVCGNDAFSGAMLACLTASCPSEISTVGDLSEQLCGALTGSSSPTGTGSVVTQTQPTIQPTTVTTSPSTSTTGRPSTTTARPTINVTATNTGGSQESDSAAITGKTVSVGIVGLVLSALSALIL